MSETSDKHPVALRRLSAAFDRLDLIPGYNVGRRNPVTLSDSPR
jgi:Mor family transcriptional regulator